MTERNILNACFDQLLLLPPVKKVRIKETQVNDHTKRFNYRIEVETETVSQPFLVEVKGVMKRPIPPHLFLSKGSVETPFLLMSEYVNPSIARDLKKNNINFIDSRGNAYIHIPGRIYVEVQGKKFGTIKDRKTTTILQPKGLQLLFVLLIDNKAVNEACRALAQKAGLSKDRVSSGLRELKDKGFIQEIGKGRYQLKNKKQLFEQWVSNYADRLRPKLVIGAYKSPPSVWDGILDEMKAVLGRFTQTWAVGGSFGADLLTHYYRGRSLEVFIQPEKVEELTKSLKLLPSEVSNLTLFNLFSPYVIGDFADIDYPVAHPLLIYAELLHHGQDREIATAKMIYERYLQKKFDEA